MQTTSQDIQTTSKNGTWTSEGFIPHLMYRDCKLPVKLDIPPEEYSMDQLFPPKTINNYYVYVLPGGQEFQRQQSDTIKGYRF